MSHKMEEMAVEMNGLKEIKKTLTSWLKEEANGGKECFDTKSCGDVSDIIKDLAEAEEKCYKAMYYKSIVDAMEKADERPMPYEYENYGYNHRHMPNGQFASAGRGRITSGYNPYLEDEDYMEAYFNDPTMRKYPRADLMGYSESGNSRGSGRSRDGELYDNYQSARRNYHDSKSETDKENMNKHCMMYMQSTLKNLKSMWNDADPMLKKKMKEDFGEDMIVVLEKL